jgi:hypothetical protein
MKNNLVNQFGKLDAFTKKQIIREHPEIFPENTTRPIYSKPLDDPYPPFDLNQFYGAALLVIALIVIIGSIF